MEMPAEFTVLKGSERNEKHRFEREMSVLRFQKYRA